MIEQLDQNIVAKLPAEIVEHIELLERVRKDFVANVSHELRTPLTVVLGYLESLLNQAQYDDTLPKDLLNKMHQQSLRMQNIIEDLLLLSRIESNKPIPVSDQLVDINHLLIIIQQSSEPLVIEKQQQLTITIDKVLKIKGNRDELHSLFSNLIFNAIKYTPAKGQIDIRWLVRDNRAIFEVQDTGIGIAENHIPRLTERFYRVDKSRSRESGGTGLGLAIVKHILIRHHGQLEIESKEEQGSTFRCVFPLGFS